MAQQTTTSAYQTVTDAIVAGLERAREWRRPWASVVRDLAPVNVRGQAYRGVNTLLLAAVAMERGYASRQWGTYKAWQERGAQVRKGEKSAPCVFWKSYEREAVDADGKPATERVLVARLYSVFNAEQVDGAPPSPVKAGAPTPFGGVLVGFTIREGVALSHGGDRAYYDRLADAIRLPYAGQFDSPEAYAATFAHECAHATGHETRLDRRFGQRFGDDAYAIEEVTAELAAAMMATAVDAAYAPASSTDYIASWLRVAREDARAVFAVASAAQRAADLVVGPGLGDLDPPAGDAPADELSARGVPDVAPQLVAAAA